MSLVTFIVPAYNVQDYIVECLESIMNQTSPNYDVVIVNDGSTDEHTTEICEKYKENFPKKIKYVYQKNKGLGAARNTGMKYVTTPWLVFLDSDDWIMPNYVEEFEKELKKFSEKQIDLFFTLPIIYENITGGCRDWYDKNLFYQIFYEGNRIVNPEIDKRIYSLEVNACRRIYRKSFLEELNFTFPEGVKWEDVYPHFYLLSHAVSCVGIQNIGFYYRTGTSGQITASTGKGRLDMIKVFAQTFEYILRNNLDKEIILIAMDLMVNFSRWSITVADVSTRKRLIRKLYLLYHSIPEQYIKEYCKVYRPENKYFIKAIRTNYLQWTMEDYLVKDIVVKMINKLKQRRGK
ncbi:MAG: glycosyltransferase family A protein [Lachnospiraceae bacterium]|nr:glycosyltransferase family A protein [Lachnospiraceae bacterium]